MDRPITTLFMLMSLDGKISPGASDELDVDKDFPRIDGLKEGLPQYYESNRQLILDNTHLTEHGVTYFCRKSKVFVLITSNKEHPAYNIKEKNLHIIFQEELSLEDALHELKSSYGCEKLTIQSGGTVNGLFLREKLFDYIDVVVAPVLIGGKETASLIDGSSITSENELSGLSVLKLIDCTILNVSYIRVRYQVIS